ncbi:Protein of unknown function DUF773 [Phytophthora cactorum]|nr:Protein of unknown function DUF773 [Phytophthora cactorum]
MNSSAEPLTFVSLEAPSLATAFRIVQTAKTNRIVRKQNAENVHFFVRLALFHGGQVSTVHLVDLVDQKEFQDPVLIQEHLELYNILQDLRQPETTSRQSSSRASAPSTSLDSTGKMILSNFMIPLLTANAKTFLYANVIDSRTSLRESVQMLNAVANLRDLHVFIYPGSKVKTSAESLGIVASTTSISSRKSVAGKSSYTGEAVFLRVAISIILFKWSLESEAMIWLNTFAQRKRDILGGSIDTIGAITSRARVPERPVPDPVPSSAFENGVRDELLQENYSTPDMRPSIPIYMNNCASLWKMSRDRIGRTYRDVSITSPAELSDPMPSSASSKPDPFTLEAFKKAGISPCVMEPPNVDGLDVKMAQRVQAADATLLRKNYDALLSIVREQQQAKEAAEARAAEAVQDQEETRAIFEVQIENMKLANVGLRSKLRALENRTSLPQVFKQYEQELCTLTPSINLYLSCELMACIFFQEKKKASILDRFVEKHGDRMKSSDRRSILIWKQGESWRRDQYARECEDKLLAAVKRSLPNAVPLCNKILRRLEMQELSLREFSEREVDLSTYSSSSCRTNLLSH